MDKSKTIYNLKSLNKELLNALVNYYFEEYKYYFKEYYLVAMIDYDYTDEIAELIIKAKQKEKLTKEEYVQSLFYSVFTCKREEVYKVLNEYFVEKVKRGIIIPNYKLGERFVNMFVLFYDKVANWFSEYLANNENISKEGVFDIIEGIEMWFDINDLYQELLTENEIQFDKDMTNFILSYVHLDRVNPNSKNSFNDYYEKYCLAGDISKKSTQKNIYYDFECRNKYRNYGDKIVRLNKLNQNNDEYLLNFLDVPKVVKMFNRFFCDTYKKERFINFNLYNSKTNKLVRFALHSYSKAIKNYDYKRTIDVVVFEDDKKVSIYPIDAENFIDNYNIIKTKHSRGE